MHPARIAELLEPFLDPAPSPCLSESGRRPEEEPGVLSPSQLGDISTYIDMLVRWNARINLTAIRNPEEIVTRHFGESLFAACHLFPTGARQREGHDSSRAAHPSKPEAGALAPGAPANAPRRTTNDRLADLGSGAGFPGIPIKLWAPHLAVTLIESNQKKAAFLREVARALTLTNINIFPGRAQDLAKSDVDARHDDGVDASSSFDLVTLRAVERFGNILPIAASLVAPGGRLALLIGVSQLERAHDTLSTFHWHDPRPIPLSTSRILAVGVPG